MKGLQKKKKFNAEREFALGSFVMGEWHLTFFSTFGGIPEKWTQPLIGLKDVNLFYLIP